MPEDQSTEETAAPEADDRMDVDTEPKDEEDAGDDKSENDAEPEAAADASGEGEPAVSIELYKALRNITEILTNLKVTLNDDEEHFPAQLFKRIPNRRVLPDYHEIIQDPVALSTLKQKIQRKQYSGVPEFVRDFALIVHNAQVYNRPNSAPVRDVFLLRDSFKEEMQKLVEEGLVKEEETAFPDLGEIPDATPEPNPGSDDDEDDEDDEDDDDLDGDDSGDDRRRRRLRKSRTSISGRKGDDDADGRKRRGRPPRVDTPMEARIKAILKGIRKPKDKAGNLKVLHFERLPDKADYPAYFLEIKEPIALDTIKKKLKRKKYSSVEGFMKDMELLFNNAKAFNEDGSEIYQDAIDLQAEAVKLAEIENAKPDSEYLMEDGRNALPYILHKNEMWKVGDWIHIQNVNDVTKPIVAQIYRIWQDSERQNWFNACWYYRPEQTVHQYEKHFLPNEVVKTGQYRDHKIEEVVDRCFVMFVTRYSRGRPRDFDPTKEVYVCEARYNEEKHRFNKIKTWASCLPDEVREKDYEMDLFEFPRRIKKVPSPLKHLLKDDTKETDETPSPQWGDPNAPPKIGAIHKGPRDENQSPPPEPTPPPPPTPLPQPVRTPSAGALGLQPRPIMDPRSSTPSANLQPQVPRPSPALAQNYNAYHSQPISPAAHAARLGHQRLQPISSHPNMMGHPSIPQTPVGYTNHAQILPSPSQTATPVNYGAPATPTQGYGHTQMTTTTASNHAWPTYPASTGFDHRPGEVFVLSDAANELIPKRLRDTFPCDDKGRVLFFTTPPVQQDWTVRGRDGQPLVHTKEYLRRREERENLRAERNKTRHALKLGLDKRQNGVA